MGSIVVSERLSAEVITDPAELARHCAGWDTLAVSAARPYCSPGWALPCRRI